MNQHSAEFRAVFIVSGEALMFLITIFIIFKRVNIMDREGREGNVILHKGK